MRDTFTQVLLAFGYKCGIDYKMMALTTTSGFDECNRD